MPDRWLVTVATGDTHHSGPSVVVEADSAVEAAEKAACEMIENESAWGFTCRHCEAITVDALACFLLDDAVVVDVKEHFVAREIE